MFNETTNVKLFNLYIINRAVSVSACIPPYSTSSLWSDLCINLRIPNLVHEHEFFVAMRIKAHLKI